MIGTRLANRYELLEQLGAGGMGVVYRARDPWLERDVAVKMVPPTRLDGKNEARFRREARLVARMDHPGITPIHDFGMHGESLFFVMPLIEGQTLKQRLAERPLEAGEAASIAAEVAEALAHAHERGVIHRDIKPANIMVPTAAGELRVRVMDFGLARASQDPQASQTGDMAGTPAYLSPEQVRGQDVDSRTDLYSLGAVLYESLTGGPPFDGPLTSVIYRIGHEPPPPLRQQLAQLDEELERIVLWCLEKRPENRPASGRELAAALRSYLRPAAHGLDDTLTDRPRTGPGRPGSGGSVVPLVGRRREWARILESFTKAASGECQLVLLGGEAGVGKSRLLRELEEVASERRVRVLRGRYSDLEESFHYEGLCELVQDYFRNLDPLRTGSRSSEGGGSTADGAAEEEDTASGLATPDLSDLASDLLTLFPVLSEIPELRQAAGAAAQGTARGIRENGETPASPTYVFELFARTLIRLADGETLVLLLENLHEADASIDALQYLVHRLAPVPILLAGTYRPAQISRGHPLLRWIRSLRDHPRVLVLHLAPLTADEVGELAGHVVGSPRLTDDLAERVYEATEGNPLFALELMRSLLDTGSLTRDAGGVWMLSGDTGLSARGALPSTLLQAVERRLERLPEALRSILAMAAVLGKSFDAQDLEALVESDGSDADLDDALDQLVEQGVLREDRKARGDRLVFVSGLVRTALYRDLPRRRRRSLHRRYARQLERRAGGRPERFYPLLVHHFSAGDVPEKTVEYALAQARRSLAAWNPEDAIRAARIALEFVEEEAVDDSRRLHGELLEVLARAHRTLGQNSQAFEEAARAVAVFHGMGALKQAAAAAWLTIQAAWQGRRVEETRHWVDKTAELARQAGEHGLERRALLLGSTVANLRGESELARHYRDEAARVAPVEVEGPAVEPVAVPRGGTLRAALPISLHLLDPAAIDSDENREAVATIFETLLRLDSEGNLLPALATDWQSADDGRRFELTLERGLRFSDGHALTAAGVKTSFERLARRRTEAPPAALAALTGREAFLRGESPEIAGIRVVDDEPHRLVFRLDEPLPIFPVFLTDLYTAVVREPRSGSLAGTGPFRLAALEEDRAVLERNPRFRRQAPRLERLEFHTGLSASRIAEGLRSEELDLGRDLLLADLEELLRDPRFRTGLVETTRTNVHFLLWNQAGPLARHPELRRALSAAVDPSDLVWRTLGRFAQPAVCLIPPGIPGHDPGRRHRSLTAEESRKLLRNARLPRPIRLSAVVHPVFLNRGRDMIRALFEVWSAVGVEVDLAELDIDAYLDKYLDNRDVDLLLGRWNADYDDPDTFTYGLFHSRHGLFRHYYASDEADRVLERARYETAMPGRQVLYQQLERLLDLQDAVVPLFHDLAYRLAGPQVHGLQLESVPPFVNYAAVGKDEAPQEISKTTRWPLERGELHIPIIAPLASLDPVGDTFAEHIEVVSTVFESLTRLDENAGVVPWLAESFEATENGRTYRVRLRDDVRFHDGRRLTARDVRYSFERALKTPHTGLHFLLLPIRGARALRDGRADALAGLEILSANELTLDLEEPVPFFSALLAHPSTGIVAEGSESFTGSWRDGCVGTGPFRVLRFEKAKNVDLERHPQYWRPGWPRSERLTFHSGQEPRHIVQEFREGRFSLAADLRPDDVEALRREPELARGCLESPRLSTVFLVLNSRRGPLADVSLRRTLARSLDVEALFFEAAGPQAQAAHGLIPPGLVGHEEPRPTTDSPPDASQLRGVRVKVAVIPGYIGQYTAVTEELERTLRRLGMTVEVLYAPVSKLVEMTLEGTPDVICMRWLADYPDPDSFVSGLLHSRDGILAGMCSQDEIDRLIELGRGELDPALRHAVYRELEELLERQAHVVPLLHEQSYRFRRPSVKGVKVYFALPEIRYEEIWSQR